MSNRTVGEPANFDPRPEPVREMRKAFVAKLRYPGRGNRAQRRAEAAARKGK